jgi:cytochrome c556
MTLRAALAMVAVALSARAVLAQPDPATTRANLMKQSEAHAGTIVQMMRGQRAFDAGLVEAAFAQWADTARKLPGLFPENSKSGGGNRASPKIWLSKKDFDQKAAAFGKAVADNRERAKASLNGLRAAIPLVGKACDDCHKDYRRGKQ